MANETANVAAGEDLRFEFCPPLKVIITGRWQQLQDEGFLPIGIEQPADNADQWAAGHKHFSIKRKALPGSGSRKRSGVDWWALTVEDQRFNWDDVHAHSTQMSEIRRARGPGPQAVARAWMDKPFKAWLKTAAKGL